MEFQEFLGQFISQLPPLLLVIVCGGPFLWVALLFYFRSQRRRRRAAGEILERPTGNDTIPVQVNAEGDHRWMPVYEEPFIPQDPQASADHESVDEAAPDPLDLLAQARAEAEELGEIPAEPLEPSAMSPSETTIPAAPTDDPLPQPVTAGVLHTITSLPIFTRLDDGSVIRSREILSILRDQSDQRLMVQIADTAYRTLSEDPDAREQFKRVMKELSGTIMQPDDGETTALADASADLHTISLQTMQVRLSNGAVTTAREVLSVQRDLGDKRLLVQVGDVAYRTLSEDPDAREQFKRVMKELSGTIMQPDDAPPPVVPPPVQAPPPSPTPEPAQPQDESPASAVDEAADEAEDERPRMPGDLPDLTLAEEPDNYKRTRYGYVRVTKVDKAPEINIAEAIEEYLQYKIEQLPQFQRRGIHIKSAASGGVRIEVDGRSYDFVDEVTDPDVRQLLQETIDEWQERH